MIKIILVCLLIAVCCLYVYSKNEPGGSQEEMEEFRESRR